MGKGCLTNTPYLAGGYTSQGPTGYPRGGGVVQVYLAPLPELKAPS